MRKLVSGFLALTLASGIGVSFSAAAIAAPAADPPAAPAAVSTEVSAQVDDLPNPAEQKRRALREQAITGVLSGELQTEQINGSTVVNVGSVSSAGENARGGKPGKVDQYVELSRQKTDKIFVILTEFGNERHPSYPDQDTDPNTPGPIRFDGPLHNQINQPDRALDNSTVWLPDYNREYYQRTYFGTGPGEESLKTYYETQSSGRYSVDGTVSNWVKVRYNEARYGRSNGFPCGSIVCSNTWYLIQDAANQWVADQQAAGRSDADINAELATFDQWDRYDFDGDGDFNEPDGYIDHFQIVHAGGDQADGDPYQGEDAIWSHRWYVFSNLAGQTGPAQNELGGTQVGTSGLWIGDYTIQPENGGRSVFFHEYGHDLGLPDDYDTSGAGDNANEYWTLMAQSRLGAKGEKSIGDRAGDLGAWNKLQLGWLDYVKKDAGDSAVIDLGPEEYNSAKKQALLVVLPEKQVTTDLGVPSAGAQQWWSGTADNLTATMERQVTLPADPATLSFQARWNIEADYDYAFVEVDDGTGYTPIPGSITDPANGNGITGESGGWQQATFDLSAYAGSTVGLRVRYTTDGGVQGNDPNTVAGIFIDEITVTAGGNTLLTDGAENPPNGWTLDGFSAVGASSTTEYSHYYIAGYRTYVSYDKYLKSGPYNFGFRSTKPDFVEHYSYQQGLLISYWDTSFADNNVGDHPGQGLNLYIDAHPKTLYDGSGVPWRTRIQIYDAPFSKYRACSFTLHVDGVPGRIRGQAPQPVFDDTKSYFDPNLPNHGVTVANAGVKIKVLAQNGTSVKIRLSPSS